MSTIFCLLINFIHCFNTDLSSAIYVLFVNFPSINSSIAMHSPLSSFPKVQMIILGPILFNFYINDLLLFIKEAEVYNYADDNKFDVRHILDES